MAGKDKTLETRRRLLGAAGEVFAKHGFRDATIREICRKAKANVAAVHYHFGDKAELYAAVFDFARNCAVAEFEKVTPAGGSAEERLRAFVHAVLMRFFHEGRPAWLGKLVAQEMIEPTKALDSLIKQQIRPNSERLRAIVLDLTGAEMEEQELWRCTFSIAAQWLFYFHNREIVKRLNPGQRFDPKALEQLANHIVRFTLEGIKAWKS